MDKKGLAPTGEDLEMKFNIFTQKTEDLKCRIRNCVDKYQKGLKSNYLVLVLSLFFANLVNATALNGLKRLVTGYVLEPLKLMIAAIIAGIVFAIFSEKRPATLSEHGSIVIFTGLLFQVCESQGYPFEMSAHDAVNA